MPRKLDAGELVIASHNAGKIREFADFFAPHEINVIGAGELDLPEPEETETTFTGNAALKARAAADAAGKPALADDSGLCVTALGGAPGVFSARWAGPTRDFNEAMAKVEAALKEVGSEDYSAYFACALCLAWPDGHEEIVEGRAPGELVFPPRGDGGFGYDALFVPEGDERTFGEMPPADKKRYSHRARAFEKLAARCL